MSEPLLDARGVEISPGDIVIYGFSVDRSVAMAEGVVLAAGDHYTLEEAHRTDCPGCRVSLTASGLVRIRVVRRSYNSGSKPVVSLMPDRIVVLKEIRVPLPGGGNPGRAVALPTSPLPTQDEVYRRKLEAEIVRYEANLQLTEVPEWWDTGDVSLESYQAHTAKWLAESRRKLEALDG